MLYEMHIMFLFYIKPNYVAKVDTRFGTLHSRPKQCRCILDFSRNPSNLLEICSVKFVITLMSSNGVQIKRVFETVQCEEVRNSITLRAEIRRARELFSGDTYSCHADGCGRWQPPTLC